MGAVIDNGSAVGRVSSQIAKAGSHHEVTVRFVDCFDGRDSGRRRRLTAGQVCVRLEGDRADGASLFSRSRLEFLAGNASLTCNRLTPCA
jgi:hypothetical protein